MVSDSSRAWLPYKADLHTNRIMFSIILEFANKSLAGSSPSKIIQAWQKGRTCGHIKALILRLPIPTSKEILYWRIVGPTCFAYAGENTAGISYGIIIIIIFIVYIYSNVVNWMMRRTDNKGAFLLSNYVTDYANESPRIGTSKTYLETANQISSGVYALQVVVWMCSMHIVEPLHRGHPCDHIKCSN